MTQDERRKWLDKIIKSLDDARGDGGTILLGRLLNLHETNIRRRRDGRANITDRDVNQIIAVAREWHQSQVARHTKALRFIERTKEKAHVDQ